MPQRDPPGDAVRLLTPAGGMVLSVAIGGLLWGGMAIAVHLAGAL